MRVSRESAARRLARLISTFLHNGPITRRLGRNFDVQPMAVALSYLALRPNKDRLCDAALLAAVAAAAEEQ